VLTGVGGGIARDILVAEIPTVLRAELYAVAALSGASVVVIGRMLQLPTVPVAAAGGVLCFGLRFMAIRYGWHLPRACQSDQLTIDALPPSEGTSSAVDNDDADGNDLEDRVD
jgi:uncharacterized membrane protein YeiH